MIRLRIVLVEDDALISKLLAQLLGELGHEVCAIVTTEADAVVAAALHAPDLMVVDLQLAPGDGAAAMRAILRSTDMPHVFMTGGSQDRLPADATVLLNPFGELGLIEALEREVCALQGYKSWRRHEDTALPA